MKKPFIVILTGAGISAESGLSTFRAQNGLWEGHDVNEVATYEGYQRDPIKVHEFYNMLRRKLNDPQVQPNAAHFAVAQLEQQLGQDNVLVVTQNVDNLHEKAGTTQIIHMHGELLKIRNEMTNEVIFCDYDVDYTRNKYLRPHIVWFGEIPLDMSYIYDALARADYFISIGTSGNVYPAAGFVQFARQHNVKTIELNLEPSLGNNLFDQKIYGPASKVVPEFVDTLIEKFKK
ncbi:Sir2 family NAD+-dependent deacetylase [Zophobihabitans entericus]|uniref:NAD-dependent protein deacylase n=1 Tax=Zophobihabitans entericus TaxID=1635327 RepID=A0A6G9I8F3_9GAMM|nr:Sir2 family NAD+-dependent deacetylase [Zophobihabitans entericus]QIQ20491.1 NAD-dependent protein deacylase [Zophobihabitans entericus]